MPQEYIEIRGARENNLKNVSLRIPKRKITFFEGMPKQLLSVKRSLTSQYLKG